MIVENQNRKGKNYYGNKDRTFKMQIDKKIYEDLKQNKEHLYDDSVIPFQFSDDFIWFLKYNFI